jgi:hypothetical protein
MKGIYVLIIKLKYSICIRVGALGDLTFPSGLYAYVGSAQTNIELRVARHRRNEKRLFWHIDYLLNNEAAKIYRRLLHGWAEKERVSNCHSDPGEWRKNSCRIRLLGLQMHKPLFQNPRLPISRTTHATFVSYLNLKFILGFY